MDGLTMNKPEWLKRGAIVKVQHWVGVVEDVAVSESRVMLQTFFWDRPRVDKKEFQWWDYIREQIPSLAKVGFTSLWLPPVHKAANLGGSFRGYEPYDYYDLSECNQKGSIPRDCHHNAG